MSQEKDLSSLSDEEFKAVAAEQGFALEKAPEKSLLSKGEGVRGIVKDTYRLGRQSSLALQHGLAAASKNAHAIARDALSYVGLTDPRKTEAYRAKIKADRKKFEEQEGSATAIASDLVRTSAEMAATALLGTATGVTGLVGKGVGAVTGKLGNTALRGLNGPLQQQALTRYTNLVGNAAAVDYAEDQEIGLGTAVTGVLGAVPLVRGLRRPIKEGLVQYRNTLGTRRLTGSLVGKTKGEKEAIRRVEDIRQTVENIGPGRGLNKIMDDIYTKIDNTQKGMAEQAYSQAYAQMERMPKINLQKEILKFKNNFRDTYQLATSLGQDAREPVKEILAVFKNSRNVNPKTLYSYLQDFNIQGDHTAQVLKKAAKSIIENQGKNVRVGGGKSVYDLLKSANRTFEDSVLPLRQTGERLRKMIDSRQFEEGVKGFSKAGSKIGLWKDIAPHVPVTDRPAIARAWFKEELQRASAATGDLNPATFAKSLRDVTKAQKALLPKDVRNLLYHEQNGFIKFMDAFQESGQESFRNVLFVREAHKIGLAFYDSWAGRHLFSQISKGKVGKTALKDIIDNLIGTISNVVTQEEPDPEGPEPFDFSKLSDKDFLDIARQQGYEIDEGQ